MADPLFLMRSQAGVRRDGTELDSGFYADTEWVRFQRGKPRKIGGYKQLSGLLNSPIRSVFVDARNKATTVHHFSQFGVQRQLLSGLSAVGLVNRTPPGFVADSLLTWSQSVLFSSTGGSYAALIAASSPDVLDITNDVGGNVYAGDVAGTAPLTQVSDGSGPISVSGGVTTLQPFLVVYGSNGLIRNSNANDFSAATGWTTGGANKANSANVAGTKIVYGAPVRGGGQSPAGLFWALDSLVRMSYVGGTQLWAYDTLSSPTSILGKKTVVEHDGKFFWIGTDRFLFYNGIVQELPNQMNLNDFFDNLNFEHRNKVWGTKVSRFSEIWWFYPRGTDTECRNAVIFNYGENTWYDAVCSRSAGHTVQLYPKPIWSGDEDKQDTTELTIGFRLVSTAQTLSGNDTLTFASTTGVANGQRVVCEVAGLPVAATVNSFSPTLVVLSGVLLSTLPAGTVFTFSSMTTGFVAGQQISGGTSGATGILTRVTDTALNVIDTRFTFLNGETLTNPLAQTALSMAVPFAQQLVGVYAQETGQDKILGQQVLAIPASFTTCNFGLAIGNPFDTVAQGTDTMTRITGLEPDFDQRGNLTVEFIGKSYAAQPYRVLETMELPEGTPFISPRVQERILRVKVSSNEQGGFFQLGQTWLEMGKGDERGNT